MDRPIPEYCRLDSFVLNHNFFINILNNCYCRASVFASGYGGYEDFESAQFYKNSFHVVEYWIWATIVGLGMTLVMLGWSFRQWDRSGGL